MTLYIVHVAALCICLLDAEGRIVSADSESLEDGSNTKTTKQRSVADKPKTKAGRAKKAGVTEGSGGGQKRSAQVSLYTLYI